MSRLFKNAYRLSQKLISSSLAVGLATNSMPAWSAQTAQAFAPPAPVLQLPSGQDSENLSDGYISPEFRDMLTDPQRAEACQDFLDFAYGHGKGQISKSDPTPLSDFNTYGVLVAKKDGTVLFEKYAQGAGRKSKFRMFSVSKMFSVLSFGNLELAGIMKRTDLLAPFLEKKLSSKLMSITRFGQICVWNIF